MLKYGEINKLNVHGLRMLDWCPPHFCQVCFDLKTDEKNISDWIWTNLEGRFFYGDKIVGVDGKRVMCKMVGFENHSEATYFGLHLDRINQTHREELW